MKNYRLVACVLSGCMASLSLSAEAAAPEQPRVYTLRVDLDASGAITAAAPLHDGGDRTARLVGEQLRGWTFQAARAEDRPAGVSTYVRVQAFPSADGAAPRIVSAMAGPAPDRLLKPTYPADAQRRGLQGVVVLQLDTDAQGRVTAATVHDTEGDVSRAMAEAALASARNWTFHPEQVGGAPLASRILMPVCFIATPAAGACDWTGPGDKSYDQDTVLVLDPAVRVSALVALAGG